MEVLRKLSKIQSELKTKKSRYNKHGKYYYRSAEDILEAIKPLSAKEGVCFSISEVVDEVAGRAVVVSTAKITDIESGTYVEAFAHAFIEWDAKGMHAPQRSGSASSYAKKYALGNLLLIDDTEDPDATNDHGKGKEIRSAGKSHQLPVLEIGSDKYNRVYAALANGNATLEDVKARYTLTDDVLKTLK